MKTIGITQRTLTLESISETRDCLDQRWSSFFSKLDIALIPLPNSVEMFLKISSQISFDGFLLSGGNDSQKRVELENEILKYALSNAIPLMGVCHGMQMIQKHFGIVLEKINNHVAHTQEIKINEKMAVVNSYHDFGTRQTHQDFSIFAYHPSSQIIKGIKHKEFSLLGIMWHPERIIPPRQEDLNLFINFFKGKQ